jgi:hypothetical protein
MLFPLSPPSPVFFVIELTPLFASSLIKGDLACFHPPVFFLIASPLIKVSLVVKYKPGTLTPSPVSGCKLAPDRVCSRNLQDLDPIKATDTQGRYAEVGVKIECL